MLILYLSMQAMNYFRGGGVGKPAVNNGDAGSGSAISNNGEVSAPVGNMFPKGTKFDLYCYISEMDEFTDFNNKNALLWSVENIEYGNWYDGPMNDGTFTHDCQIELTKQMQNNGSIYLHVYFTEAGRSPNPADKETFSKRKTFSSFKSNYFILLIFCPSFDKLNKNSK
jgi:hypothetical protein